MDLFQIVEITENFNHAGSKATSDAAAVAEKLGFQKLLVKMASIKETKQAKIQRQIGYFFDWNKVYRTVSDHAVILLQHPFHHKQLTRERILLNLKKKKNVRFISLVHDVEKIRAFRYNDYYAREFRVMTDLADVLIVHNASMKQWFIHQGIEEKKLVNLEIFDYLQDQKDAPRPIFEKSVTVAGNLDTEKCGYITGLGEIRGLTAHLYGPNFDERMRRFENVSYHGSFPVGEIPSKLTRGFGLVWDGNSVDGCLGESGQYLRYNNPHKLSLYLSSGLPVVIWKEAAEAEFVASRQIGLCVDSLRDLPEEMEKLGEDGYRKMAERIDPVKCDLKSGFYARKALSEALSRLR